MSQPPPQLLGGLRVAILAVSGFEQVELTGPRDALLEDGCEITLLSVSPGRIQGFHHGQPADWFEVDRPIDKADPMGFDGVLLPGGVQNADKIRSSHSAQEFVRAMDRDGKPVAVICHGAWLLVSAGLAPGRRLTSWPSLQDDLRNAGAEWVDQPVAVDRNLVSSRKPADLPLFNEKFKELLALRRCASVGGPGDVVPSSVGEDG